MAQVTELITKFSFQGSTTPLTNYNEALSSSLKIMGGMVAGLAGLGAGMSAFIQSNLSAVDVMGDLASRTGVTIESIQKLGYVAQLNGASVEAMNSTLESLTQKIGLASRGGEMELKKLTNEFGALGISVKKSDGSIKNAEELIYDLQGAFSKLNLSTQEKAGILSKLGIDKTMIDTLSLSSEAMKEFTGASEIFGIVTAEQAEQAGKFNDGIDTMLMSVKAISMQLALAFAPKMNDIIGSFMEFLKANKELIKNGLGKLMDIISGSIGAIVNLVKFVGNIIDVTIGWENALKILGVALIWFNRALLTSPITWIVAGITAIILIIDDLTVAFEGGESAIRDFFLEWFGWDIVPTLKALVETFKSVFGTIKTILTDIFAFIENGFSYTISLAGSIVRGVISFFSDTISIIKTVFTFDFISSGANNMVEKVSSIISKLPTFFNSVWNSIVNLFDFSWVSNGISKLINDMVGMFKPLIDTYNSVISTIGGTPIQLPKIEIPKAQVVVNQGQLNNPTLKNPMNVSNINSRNQSSQSLQQNISIDVKTNDAKMVAPKISQELNKYMKDSATQFKKGGR